MKKNLPVNDTTSNTNPTIDDDRNEILFSMGADDDDIWGNQYLDDNADKFNPSEETFRYRIAKIRVREESPEILIKFGHPQIQYSTHYLELPGETYAAYYQCLGGDCPACAVSMKPVTRRVDFFYCPTTESVVYHVHTVNRKPNSFASRLARACIGGFPAVLLVSRPDQYTYEINRVDDRSALDKAARVIKIFLEDLATKQVDLDDIVQVVDRENMISAPKIKTLLYYKGLA